MSKDYLIKNVEVDCPICDTIHKVEKRRRLTQAIVKGEIVDYKEVYFKCEISSGLENEFVSAGLMDENLSLANAAYRSLKL